MKVGIVGHGVVGSALSTWLRSSTEHSVSIYDKFIPRYNSAPSRVGVNGCDLVFLCVPTPTGIDGLSCDVSAVEESLAWISAPVCIRSTVPPGTVDRLSKSSRFPLAFSPEYIGESVGHPWRNEEACGFCIVGGDRSIFDQITELYGSLYPGSIRLYWTTARTAELCKYMENCFLATKVAFVNQFFDLATHLEVEWEELRTLWVADPRIGESHTRVTDERGFRGRCLPKDMAAIIAAAAPFGGAPLLESIFAFNRGVCDTADARKQPCGKVAGDPFPAHHSGIERGERGDT